MRRARSTALAGLIWQWMLLVSDDAVQCTTWVGLDGLPSLLFLCLRFVRHEQAVTAAQSTSTATELTRRIRRDVAC